MFQRLKTFYFDALFRLKRAGLLILGGLLVISAVLLLLGGWMIHLATNNWPQTKGRLLKFDVKPLKNHSSHIKLEVAFNYSVGDRNFQGQYFSPMTRPGKMLRWVGRRKQNQYFVGDVVNVLYDPRNPSNGYLEAPDLFWDVCLIPVSICALGIWLLYLFVKTRRRTVPVAVTGQLERQFADRMKWRPIMQSVLERDHVVLRGVVAYSATGGLLSGWPQCHVALVASPNEFAVVPGPFTKRGIASSLWTLVLEFSLSRFWLPAIHGMFFLVEIWRRHRNWRLIRKQCFPELLTNTDTVLVVPIDDAFVYGYEPGKRQPWYRLPGQRMDEFVRLFHGEDGRADELIAYIGLMQKAELEA